VGSYRPPAARNSRRTIGPLPISWLYAAMPSKRRNTWKVLIELSELSPALIDKIRKYDLRYPSNAKLFRAPSDSTGIDWKPTKRLKLTYSLQIVKRTFETGKFRTAGILKFRCANIPCESYYEMKSPLSNVAEIKRLYEDDRLTLDQIADRYSVSRQAVHERLTRAGVTMRSSAARRKVLGKGLLNRLYDVEGRTIAEISKELGVGTATVRGELRRFGIDRRKTGPRPRDIDLGLLRRLYITDGLTQAEIAKRIAVSLRLVRETLTTNKIDFRHKPGVKNQHIDREDLHRLYVVEGLTMAETGKRLGFSSWTVSRELKRHGIR